MSKSLVRIGGMTRRQMLALTAAGAAAASLSAGRARADDGKGVLKVGSLPVVNFAAIYRLNAISKQFGFGVEFVNFPNGTERLNALAAGQIDAGGTGVTQPILLRSKGVPLKIVSDLSRKGKGLMVGSGIKTFDDLRGKDIGSVPGSSPDIFLRKKLAEVGLDPTSDVNLVNIGFLEMPTAVQTGRIAGASGNEPYIATFVGKGGQVLSYLDDTALGDIDGVLNFPDSFIQKDRELAKAVIAGIEQATEELSKDPELVVATMADQVKADKAVILLSLNNLKFSARPDAKALDVLAKTMKEMQIIDRVPDVDEYLDQSLLS